MIDRLFGFLPGCVLCLLLLWVCLPFGSVTHMGELTVQLSAFFGLAAAIANFPAAGARRIEVTVVFPGLALAGLAGLGALQAQPWPRSLVQAISPGHLRLREAAAALTGPSIGPAGSVPLSLAPDCSESTALLFAAIAACYLTGALAGRDRTVRRWLGAALLCSALFQVLYGAQAWSARSPQIWDVEVAGVTHRLRGTFVNPNHLATYLEIALAAAGAWVWWGARRARSGPAPLLGTVLLGPPILLWLTLLTCLGYTASRAGLVAALAGMAFQALAFGLASRRWKPLLLGIGGIAAGLLLVSLQGPRLLFASWLQTSAYSLSWNARFSVAESAFELWRGFPWTGTGMGTFGEVFALVQPSELPGLWDHAHNDPLELLVTTGVAGATLLFVGIGVLLVRLFVVLRRGRRSEDRGIALAALGALAATGVHSLFDFGLQMPANAVTLAILCGAATAPALSSPAPGA